MKVIIAGTRDITDLSLVEKAIKDSGFEITEVVSGHYIGQGEDVGVDLLGEKWAKANNIPIKLFPADWNVGTVGGPIRNGQMAEYSDALICVWDGKSSGSSNMIDQAVEHGLQFHVLNIPFAKKIGEIK